MLLLASPDCQSCEVDVGLQLGLAQTLVFLLSIPRTDVLGFGNSFHRYHKLATGLAKPVKTSAYLMTQALQQSENDKRLYRHICLPNGLKAVLISDPETRVDGTDEEADQGEETSVDEDGEDSDSEEEVCWAPFPTRLAAQTQALTAEHLLAGRGGRRLSGAAHKEGMPA